MQLKKKDLYTTFVTNLSKCGFDKTGNGFRLLFNSAGQAFRITGASKVHPQKCHRENASNSQTPPLGSSSHLVHITPTKITPLKNKGSCLHYICKDNYLKTVQRKAKQILPLAGAFLSLTSISFADTAKLFINLFYHY